MKHNITDSQLIATDSTGDKAGWAFEGGVNVLRFVVSVIGTEATTATIKLQKQVGTAARVDLGEVVLPASNQLGNAFVWIPAGGQVAVEAGATVIATVSADATGAKPCIVKLVYQELGELPANNARVSIV